MTAGLASITILQEMESLISSLLLTITGEFLVSGMIMMWMQRLILLSTWMKYQPLGVAIWFSYLMALGMICSKSVMIPGNCGCFIPLRASYHHTPR
jgi:hypothetical protein